MRGDFKVTASHCCDSCITSFQYLPVSEDLQLSESDTKPGSCGVVFVFLVSTICSPCTRGVGIYVHLFLWSVPQKKNDYRRGFFLFCTKHPQFRNSHLGAEESCCCCVRSQYTPCTVLFVEPCLDTKKHGPHPIHIRQNQRASNL